MYLLAACRIVGRLHNVQFSNAAKALDLRNREIADANRPDLALVEEPLHRFGRLFDRHQRVGPVRLIDIDVISAQSPQRASHCEQDPVSAGVPGDLSILPLEAGFGGDDDA